MPSGAPLTANWSLYALPGFLVASQTGGRGASELLITLNKGAVVGNREYLRFNGSPRGSIPGLETRDIAVPIEVVE